MTTYGGYNGVKRILKENHHWCSTCPLVFCCCELIHVIFFKRGKKELLANSQNDNHYFHPIRQPRTILSKNSRHFVNLLSFVGSSFFPSLRKITWLNWQQPKIRRHVKHHYLMQTWYFIIFHNFILWLGISFIPPENKNMNTTTGTMLLQK